MAVFLLGVFIYVRRVIEWKSYTPAGAGGYGGEADRAHVEKPGGLLRWLTTVDHKDIGIMYGAFAMFAFAWGGIAVLIMRTELLTPDSMFITSTTYNGLMTSHGLTMLFLFGTPILAALSNYFVPLLIGADDMAFPRINAIAFWLLPMGAVLIWAGFLLKPLGLDVSPAQTAWTLYTPLATEQANRGVDLLLLGLHLTGVSATMGAINFITTIITERADDVDWANLDLFSWTVMVQSAQILFSFPVLGSAIVMLLLDRNFGTTFFTVEGGSPLLWQHLFWFFGHPEVYILVLPPMGIVSYILPKFTGRRLFGFKFVVYSTFALGVLSFGVWAHHMFATGMDPRIRASFMAVSIAIAIPSAVKTFNWMTTMYKGSLRLTTPMLFCIGFIANFIIGGILGVFEAAIPVDLILHDTYQVVAHFHYVIMGSIAFAIFAAIYYWFPIVTGRMYQRKLGKIHFWLSMVGTSLTFAPMVVLGHLGMPRRYATYDVAVGPVELFAGLHQLATLGAFVLAVGQLIFVLNIAQSWYEGRTVDDTDPWDLEADGMLTREWQWFDDHHGDPIPDGGSQTPEDERQKPQRSTTESEEGDR
mgnify:CR=1 FL=1